VQWTQVYTPLGNLYLSALVAAIPVVVLLGAIVLHVKAHLAALMGLAIALGLAIVVYGMPVKMAFAAATMGAAFGLLPIGWIILNAIFVYDLTVKTGKFDVVKETIAGIGGDRRIQVLLIGFSFGAFIEGAAGFGTPVAISAAMLIGLGFRPLQAAGLALIGNTAPVAYGALGTPVITLAKVTGLNEGLLSAMVGRQLPFFSVIVPFWLVWAMAGFRGMAEVWPACLVTGVAFAIPQFLISNYFGPSLVDVGAALVSLSCTYLLLKFWRPKQMWRFPDEREVPHVEAKKVSFKDAFTAWMPWIILSVLVFIWGLPWVKTQLNGFHGWLASFHLAPKPSFEWPGLHNMVVRAPPVVAKLTPEPANYAVSVLSATGPA
jgi:lactate permease